MKKSHTIGGPNRPTCPTHKSILLPEGKELLHCPDCDHAVTRESLGEVGKRPKSGDVVRYGGLNLRMGARKKGTQNESS